MAAKRIYLSSPTMHGEEQQYVQEAFDTNWVAPLGPNVNALEAEMAVYLGKASYEGLPVHTAALSSGTAALHLAVKLMGIERGDIVFCQSLTFSASVNPVVYEAATPVFIDSEPDTWNMSPEALKKAFEKYPHPKAVLPVHLYGTPAKLDEILAICREHDVPVIEDAAEALGSRYRGAYCGTFGRIGALSFNGNKIITTSGGGMLVAPDEEVTKRATYLATQARDPAPHYQHSTIGYNYRMSNVTAGIGRGQLIHLDEHLALKQAIYRRYREGFADLAGITMNPMNPDGEANNWLSCITIDPAAGVSPAEIQAALEADNIESRPIWKPMHLQPVFEGAEFYTDEGRCEESESEFLAGKAHSVSADIFARGICLPSDIKNTEEDMERIIGIVRGLFS